MNAAWCAGMFIGKGCTCKITSRNSSGTFDYIHIQISMRDERAITLFAKHFGVNYRVIFVKAHGYDIYRVSATGRTAEKILAAMWPFVKGTDKGDQAERVARELEVFDWISGKRTDQRP